MAVAKYFGLRGKALEHFIIWAVICPAYILFGWNNALAGGLLDLESWNRVFPRIDTLTTTRKQKANNARVQGTVVSIYTLGCFFGSLSCIWIGDRLGRIRTIMLGAVFNVIGSILQASSFSLGQLVVGRIISGLGFGTMSATAPNWQSECSKAEYRGSVVLLESVFISFGLALVAWITYGVSYAAGSVTWRLPMALSGLWSLIVLVAIFRLPESPRWLVKKGRLNEAREVLSALEDVPMDSDQINRAVHEIQSSLTATGQGRFLDIFTNGEQRLFHRTCLATAGQLFQQLSGINTLAFYISTIFRHNLGLTGADSRILGAAVFTWQMLASPIGVLTVDRFGRRKLMLISCIGMGVSMAVLAGTVSQPHNRGAVITASVFLFVFPGFFPIGFLGLTFLYASEIAPLSIRVPVTSISTGTAWLFNFLVAEVTPVGFATISWRYHIVWAVFNLCLILPCVYFFFPETSGRSLEEVDEIFRNTKNIFDAVRISKSLPKKSPVKRGVALLAETTDSTTHQVDDLADQDKEQVER